MVQPYCFPSSIAVFLILASLSAWGLNGALSSTNTTITNLRIGALIAFNTTIGEFSRNAIELAINEINNAKDMLHGVQIALEMLDTGCNPVQGAASAVELMSRGVVAIVGPQSSSVAQFVAHLGRATNVPIVSFAATDPNLSEMQYPYLFRVAPSDVLQMEAVATFIANYGWKEVAVLHIDDDHGRNGASSLSDSLQVRGSKLVDKLGLPPRIDKDGIDEKLMRLNTKQTRVFVLHTPGDIGFQILKEAHSLKMMDAGYIWIVTDLITTSLGNLKLDPNVTKITQGVIGLRRYIAHSPQLDVFLNTWQSKFQSSLLLDINPSQINAYGLYAYDAVWAIMHAVSLYLNEENTVNFYQQKKSEAKSGSNPELSHLKVFAGGGTFKDMLFNVKFVGASGPIHFNSNGDLAGAAFEYINMVGRTPHTVGYWWTNHSGVSLHPPPDDEQFSMLSSTMLHADVLSPNNAIHPNTTKLPIIWPGFQTDTPRGWTVPKQSTPLRIGVPRKAGYTELVSVTKDVDNKTSINGFCIEVFKAALSHLPYDVPYKFELYGDGVTTPQYQDLIVKLENREYDAVVGDVTILADRLRVVDFTQPYIESGLVVLAPIEGKKANSPWAFLRPFTSTLWTIVLLSFIFTGVVIWILEHNVNENFRGPPKTQFITVLTFIFSTLFFAHKEDTRSFLGRIVMIIWLFVILIINSSYTANLTSILTVEQLAPSIQGLDNLIQSNLPIGYQTGSFVRDYLINLKVDPKRLRPLQSREAYTEALDAGSQKGGVAAIVDEIPYVQLLQSSDCQRYVTAGPEFTKSGWGFAFPRGSEITSDLSQAILLMSQSGELQSIDDHWFKSTQCKADETSVQSDMLDLNSFWGLFLISGVASALCMIVHLTISLKKYRRDHGLQGTTFIPNAQFLQHLKQFLAFMDKSINEKEVDKSSERKDQDKSIHGKELGHYDTSTGRPCSMCGSHQYNPNASIPSQSETELH